MFLIKIFKQINLNIYLSIISMYNDFLILKYKFNLYIYNLFLFNFIIDIFNIKKYIYIIDYIYYLILWTSNSNNKLKVNYSFIRFLFFDKINKRIINKNFIFKNIYFLSDKINLIYVNLNINSLTKYIKFLINTSFSFSFLYIRAFVFILFIDACLTDDEPL